MNPPPTRCLDFTSDDHPGVPGGPGDPGKQADPPVPIVTGEGALNQAGDPPGTGDSPVASRGGIPDQDAWPPRPVSSQAPSEGLRLPRSGRGSSPQVTPPSQVARGRVGT